MSENINLVWKATDELTKLVHIWNNPTNMKSKSFIFVPLFICKGLTSKMLSKQDLPSYFSVFNTEFEENAGKIVNPFLDLINTDDMNLLDLIRQYVEKVEIHLKNDFDYYPWREFSDFIGLEIEQDYEVTSNEILLKIEKCNLIKSRTCLKPLKWNDFYEMVNSKISFREEENFPLPLILASWNSTSDKEKFERFHEQLKIVADKGYIQQIKVLVDDYSEEDWHHFGE